MYLRTPKRYQKQRRHVLSLRWLWLWIVTPLVVVAGWQIYENRDQFAPPVQQALQDLAANARSGVATITAPTPPPTEDPARRMQVARSAWSQGSIDEALREYEAILPSLPNDVETHYRYTFGLIMQGRAREALEAAEKTVTANPFSSDAWAVRALALNENGRQGEAIASAMQALQLKPNDARATAFLAEAYFDSNQVERALTTVEKAMERDPDSFEALYVYGRIQAESQFDFVEAAAALERAYAIAPNMPYLGVQLASVQLRDNPEAGFETLQHILEMNPQNTEALYTAGYVAFSQFGDPNQALDFLTRCVDANPNSAACHWYMGQVYFNTGQNERARDAFMRAIDAGTTNTRYYLSAGRMNISLNNCAVALPLLREGYDIESARPSPNTDRLAEFEEAMQGCGAGASPAATPVPADATTGDAPAVEITAEPPLGAGE